MSESPGKQPPAQIAAIETGYGFTAPSLVFGAAVYEDVVYPQAQVRIPCR